MLINKTVDECIIETGGALFQCLVDSNLTVEEKKLSIQWLILFLNYQDAIINYNKEKINILQEKLTTNFTTDYYKKALQEFNNANIIYNNNVNLSTFKNTYLENSPTTIKDIIYKFNETFTTTLEKHKQALTYFDLSQATNDFLLLFFVIHYHLGYQFKLEILPIIKKFIAIVKTPLYLAQNDSHIKILLMRKILQDNESFFEAIEPIQLRNFIHSLDDIFTDGLNINNKVERLILTRPHRIKCSMNMLLQKHGINLETILLQNDNKTNAIAGNMIMHLFAYETYYVQRNHNYDTYENLVLNNVLTDPLYQQIFTEYKKSNKIIKAI